MRAAGFPSERVSLAGENPSNGCSQSRLQMPTAHSTAHRYPNSLGLVLDLLHLYELAGSGTLIEYGGRDD